MSQQANLIKGFYLLINRSGFRPTNNQPIKQFKQTNKQVDFVVYFGVDYDDWPAQLGNYFLPPSLSLSFHKQSV